MACKAYFLTRALQNYNHTYSFTYSPWLLSSYNGRTEYLWQRPCGPQNLKYLSMLHLWKKKFVKPSSKTFHKLWNCWLQIVTYLSMTNGTCWEHLPVTEQQGQSPFAFSETNPVLLQLLTVNTSWGSSGWNEALCAPGYLAEQVFRSVAGQAPLPMGILQARILKWGAYPLARGSSWPRNWTRVSYIAGGFFTSWATREALVKTYQFSR